MVLTGRLRRRVGLNEQLATHCARQGLTQVRQQLVQLEPCVAVLWLRVHHQSTGGHVQVGGIHGALAVTGPTTILLPQLKRACERAFGLIKVRLP